jgi:hypothetical protein
MDFSFSRRSTLPRAILSTAALRLEMSRIAGHAESRPIGRFSRQIKALTPS